MRTPMNKWSRRDDTEEGFVLIFVLILSVALITMLTFAVSSSVGNLDNAANYGNSGQAQNSAMSGLSAATNAMATAGAITALPCTVGTPTSPISMALPQVSDASDTYSVVITYSNTGASDPCTPGSGPATTPTAAVLVSTGTTAPGTPGAKTVVMQETMTIAATPASLTAPFTYAMFSQGTLDLQKGLNVISPSSCIGLNGTTVPTPCGNVYGNVINDCQGNSLISGSVQVGTTLVATLVIGNQCDVTGALYVDGNVTLKNGATVTGDIHAYGGNVTLEDSASVGGNIYASAIAGIGGGTINIDTNFNIRCVLSCTPSVGGNLYAATTVTAVIAGVTQFVQNLLPLVSVAGTVNFPVTSGMPPTPASQTFPQLNPTAVTLAASIGDTASPTPHHYTVISITGSAQPACSNAFVEAAQVTYTTPTAIYAPACVVSMSGKSTFSLGSNEIWVVGGFSEGGGLTVTNVSTNNLALSVVVTIGGACPGGDISLGGNTNTFDVTIKLLLYTPCDVAINGNQYINGQIVAGGNISTTGNVNFTFDQSASKFLPGTSGSPIPTPTVTGKTVTNG